MGIERKGLVEETLDGYDVPFLDGIWLRGPYLHNGSVPTLRDLLNPVEQRPKEFWRGYNVYNPMDVGFVASGLAAEREGTRLRVTDKAGSNQGHEFGTKLPAPEKETLLEFLKTL